MIFHNKNVLFFDQLSLFELSSQTKIKNFKYLATTIFGMDIATGVKKNGRR